MKFRTDSEEMALRYAKNGIELGKFTLTMPEFTKKPLDYCPEPYDPEEYTPFSDELPDYGGID